VHPDLSIQEQSKDLLDNQAQNLLKCDAAQKIIYRELSQAGFDTKSFVLMLIVLEQNFSQSKISSK
jgi:hypothetical protein